MLFKTASAVAVLAVAAQAADFMMSSRDVFGLSARAEDSGYAPTQTFCGNGTTCTEACGAGFDVCTSTDASIHCYNAAAKSICCSDGSGNSCDVGYYCAGSTSNGTLCCLNGQSTEDCAKANGLSGALTSYAPKPTTSSKPSSYSTLAPNTTTKSTSPTTDCTSTIAPTNTYGAANTTKSSYPTSSPSTVPVSAAAVAGPASAFFALAIAGFAAALL